MTSAPAGSDTTPSPSGFPLLFLRRGDGRPEAHAVPTVRGGHSMGGSVAYPGSIPGSRMVRCGVRFPLIMVTNRAAARAGRFDSSPTHYHGPHLESSDKAPRERAGHSEDRGQSPGGDAASGDVGRGQVAHPGPCSRIASYLPGGPTDVTFRSGHLPPRSASVTAGVEWGPLLGVLPPGRAEPSGPVQGWCRAGGRKLCYHPHKD